MDFFDFMSIGGVLENEDLWPSFLIGGLGFALMYVFKTIALLTIAMREGYKNKWMLFIPFFSTYYIGVCAQKNKLFNMDARTIGLVTAITELLLFSGYVLDTVVNVLVSDYRVVVSTEVIGGVQFNYYGLSGYPASLSWAAWVYNYFERFILRFVSFVYRIFDVALLICFFQTYACRRYVLFTITSILFPIQGILFFVVRNNSASNYKDFLHGEQARQYAMYHQYRQQQQNYNQNPYNGNYGSEPYSGDEPNRSAPPDDPFGDMGGGNGGKSDGSPFDEFDN